MHMRRPTASHQLLLNATAHHRSSNRPFCDKSSSGHAGPPAAGQLQLKKPQIPVGCLLSPSQSWLVRAEGVVQAEAQELGGDPHQSAGQSPPIPRPSSVSAARNRSSVASFCRFRPASTQKPARRATRSRTAAEMQSAHTQARTAVRGSSSSSNGVRSSRPAQGSRARSVCAQAVVAPPQAPAAAPAPTSSTSVRLPSSHLESSKKALESLKAQSVNRESISGSWVGGVHRGVTEDLRLERAH
jgi:hypothetical protein